MMPTPLEGPFGRRQKEEEEEEEEGPTGFITFNCDAIRLAWNAAAGSERKFAVDARPRPLSW